MERRIVQINSAHASSEIAVDDVGRAGRSAGMTIASVRYLLRREVGSVRIGLDLVDGPVGGIRHRVERQRGLA